MSSLADAGTPLFWGGWFVAICATTLQNVGLYLLKKAHLKFLGNNNVTILKKREDQVKKDLENDIISKCKRGFSKFKNKAKRNSKDLNTIATEGEKVTADHIEHDTGDNGDTNNIINQGFVIYNSTDKLVSSQEENSESRNMETQKPETETLEKKKYSPLESINLKDVSPLIMNSTQLEEEENGNGNKNNDKLHNTENDNKNMQNEDAKKENFMNSKQNIVKISDLNSNLTSNIFCIDKTTETISSYANTEGSLSNTNEKTHDAVISNSNSGNSNSAPETTVVNHQAENNQETVKNIATKNANLSALSNQQHQNEKKAINNKKQLENSKHKEIESIDNEQYKNRIMTKSGTIKYWMNPNWWVAFIVFVLGVILDLVSLSMLPASLTLPIGSFGLIVSALCSTIGLGERFTPLDGVGTALLIIGSWLTIIFIPKERGTYDIALMLTLVTWDMPGLYWCICMGIATLILTFVVVGLRRFQIAILAAILPGCVGLFLNIFGKVCAESLLATFNGGTNANAFEAWQFYIFVILLIFVAIMQNHWLQRGLCLYDNMIIVPGYFVSLMICNCLNGILFFREFTTVSVGGAILFAVGILLVCTGCICISVSHNKNREKFKSQKVAKMIREFTRINAKQDSTSEENNSNLNSEEYLESNNSMKDKLRFKPRNFFRVFPTSAFIIYNEDDYTTSKNLTDPIKDNKEAVTEKENKLINIAVNVNNNKEMVDN